MSNEFELSESRAALSATKQALLNKRLQTKLMAPRTISSVIPKCPPGPSPLSFSQQQLFFIDQLESGGSAYNFSIAVRLEGRLDISVLEKAINEIIRRHQSLRTRFVTVGLETVQQVLPELNVSIQLEDLSHPDNAEKPGRFAALVSQETLKPFCLSECPLLRVKLFLLSEHSGRGKEYVLVITMPHIITDGWSAAVLYKELASLYEAYSRGLRSPLSELSIQYTDFSYWQRQRLQPAVLEEMFSFWEQHLSGLNSDIELPTDRARPSVQTYQGRNCDFFLSKKLSEKVVQLYRSRKVTLFALLFSAFNVLLHRICGQQHLCVGTPVANRNRSETETLIGYFVNVLALHTDLSGNPSFTALLERTHRVMLEAQPHQEYPFELLVRKLNRVRDPSMNPLFQVMFVLHNVPFESIEVSGLRITPFPIENKISKFDLTLHVTEEIDGLFLSFEYNVDLFDEDRIKRMGDHFQVLLEQIVAAPQTRIGDLDLLTQMEKNRFIRAWNGEADNLLGTKALPEMPRKGFIHHRFEDQARLQPSAIAVSSDGITLTYSELNDKANRLAHYLLSRGLKSGAVIALFMGRRPEMVVGILGVLKAGAAYLPIDPQYPRDEIAYLLEDSGAALVLTRATLLADLPDTDTTLICIDRDWEAIAQQPALNPATVCQADGPAYLIYTSGSTGRPKGVLVSHRNLLHSTKARFTYYQSRVTAFLLLSSFAFDSSVAGIFWTLSQGGKLCIPPDGCRDDPEYLTGLISEERISHLLGLPSFYKVLLEYADRDQLESLRVAIVAGEICSVELAQGHYAKLPGTELHNEYGPTEGSVWCSVYRIQPNPGEGQIPIGRAVPGAKLYLLDAYLNPVPVGVSGEVYVGGAGVSLGYLNQAALTAERFIPDGFDRSPGARLYRSGDLARYQPDGTILFMGRADHQIKIRGFRVELEQIETKLMKHPAIQAAVVVVQELSSGNKNLLAYLVKSPEGPRTDAVDLRAFLKNQLPAYMIPSAISFVECFPLTSNGKLDRKALTSRAVELPSKVAHDLPRNPTETLLRGIWRQVLGLEEIGVRDNFFEIGGDSILAMQMVGRAKQAGLSLTPRQVLEHQTIEALAEALAQSLNTSSNFGGNKNPRLTIDLTQEAVLDEAIAPDCRWVVSESASRHILLTGVTGFVGPFLLDELLRSSQAMVYCLVRCACDQQAADRIEETQSRYAIHNPQFKHRIVPLSGNLAESRFGWTEARFREMAGKIDVIYHNGSSTNQVLPYAALKAANVSGTSEVLRLACTEKIKPVHYVSTLSIFDDGALPTRPGFSEDDLPELTTGLSLGYAQSKLVAEYLLHVAYKRGLPVTVYRLGAVTGHSLSGAWKVEDLYCRFLKLCLELGMFPMNMNSFMLMPVDFVSRAIAGLSALNASRGRNYHLFNPRRTPLSVLMNWLSRYGYRCEKVTRSQWVSAFSEYVSRCSEPSLQAIAGMVESFVEQDHEDLIPYQGRRTEATLNQIGIPLPAVNEGLFVKSLDYLVQSGFLGQPLPQSRPADCNGINERRAST